MFDAVGKVLAEERRIGYALVFGSCARGSSHAASDLDIAIGGLSEPLAIDQLGDLIGRLESATGRPIDLTLLDEAAPGLAYRVFRDGVVVLERDRPALVQRKARAILDYLDFKPIEDLLTKGALEAAKRGR
jgi:predicted nucleotidyltransferase